MTVFLAHAPADRQSAEALEKVIERRGQFAELDDGQTALKPVQSGDVFVLLVSTALTVATARLRLQQRALDAWAAGRLVVVRLDHGIPPVGLRDLPAIDATFEAAREFKWNEIADAIRDILRAPHPEEDDGGAGQAEPPQQVRRKSGGGLGVLVLATIAMVPGALAIATTVAIWLVNRIGPTPGGWPDLIREIEGFGARYGLPAAMTPWLFAASVLLLLAALIWVVSRLFARPAVAAPGRALPRRRGPAPPADAVFISYARANEETVLPIITAAKRAGRKFWLDQQGISAGDGWAGEIVRAIKGAAGVVVMCSKAAFESDHVKREIYLADRYRKKLVPVFIEQAEPPEDFEYFFAGVQTLNLVDTPEADRPEALIQALGATP